MRLMIAVALAVPLFGCDLDAPCGDEFVFDDVKKVCIPPPPDAGPAPRDAGEPADSGDITDGGTLDASAPDAAPQDSGPDCSDPGFGTVCTVAGEGAPECVCEADFCALQPGQAEGFCTRIGCLGVPGICPSDYECMDLSLIAPEVGSICVPR